MNRTTTVSNCVSIAILFACAIGIAAPVFGDETVAGFDRERFEDHGWFTDWVRDHTQRAPPEPAHSMSISFLSAVGTNTFKEPGFTEAGLALNLRVFHSPQYGVVPPRVTDGYLSIAVASASLAVHDPASPLDAKQSFRTFKAGFNVMRSHPKFPLVTLRPTFMMFGLTLQLDSDMIPVRSGEMTLSPVLLCSREISDTFTLSYGAFASYSVSTGSFFILPVLGFSYRIQSGSWTFGILSEDGALAALTYAPDHSSFWHVFFFQPEGKTYLFHNPDYPANTLPERMRVSVPLNYGGYRLRYAPDTRFQGSAAVGLATLGPVHITPFNSDSSVYTSRAAATFVLEGKVIWRF